MKSSLQPNNITLNNLLTYLKDGQYEIPNFQRDFEWNPWDLNDLLRSIFMDYYIGNLLLWKGKENHFSDLSCQPIFCHSSPRKKQHIVLDGQQRLSAIYYSMISPDVAFPKKKGKAFYFVNINLFMNGQTDEAFYYKWNGRLVKSIVDNKVKQYSEHTFPVSVLGGDLFAVGDWLRGYVEHCTLAYNKALSNLNADADTDDVELLEFQILENAKAFETLVKDMVSQYKIPTIELSEDLELETVCDIFTRLNSKGVKLDVFDLINALLTPKKIELKKLWHESRERFSDFQSDKFDIYTLQIMSILLQNYCSPKFLFHLIPETKKKIKGLDGKFESIILIKDDLEFKDKWYEATEALEKTVKRLQQPQQYGVSSAKYLPYKSILPVFAALNKCIENSHSDLRFIGQKKLEHWYWASIFTSRYSGSVASKSAKDFQDVSDWINDDDSEPAVVQEFRNTYENLELHGERKSGTSTYNGIFNLLIRRGAPDFVRGQIPDYDQLDDHHIVPASWGRENLPDDMFNSILNRTPLDRRTNRGVLGKDLPNVYIKRMITNIGREEALKCFSKHLISEKAVDILQKDPFTPADFQDFLDERRRMVITEVGNLLVGDSEPETNLQKLKNDIDSIEIQLRKLIAGEDVQIKPHVLSNIENRMKIAARNNPSLASDSVSMIEKLSFSDLRELEEMVLMKENWLMFEKVFLSKQTVGNRFSQLCNLRNAIAHKRNVDLPTLKDGQAAIHWFNEFLKLT